MAKRLRKIKRIVNQSEIARRMNLTPQYIGMLMAGKRKNARRIGQIHAILLKEIGTITGQAA